MDVVLDPMFEERFRRAAARRFGLRKGSLSRAAVEALEVWVSLQERGTP